MAVADPLAQPTFNETSFMTQVSHELRTQMQFAGYRLLRAPDFPTQQREADVGYDANLDYGVFDFYLQFKVSQYRTHWKSRYFQPETGPFYSSAYYEFPLRHEKQNRQHSILYNLGQQRPYTYYVSPEIEDDETWEDLSTNGNTLPSTRFLPLTSCQPIADRERHYITYQPGVVGFTQHSEPQRNKGEVRGIDWVREVVPRPASLQRLTNSFSEHVLEAIEKTGWASDERPKRPAWVESRWDILFHAAGLLRKRFNTELLIAIHPRK